MLTAANIRLLLVFAIVAAIAGIVALAVKKLPNQDAASPAAIADKENRAELNLRGIRVSETANGSTRWTLVAEKAEYDSTRAVVNLADVKLSVSPLDKNLGELILKSPTATYHTETRDVFLSGGVHARNSKGMEFTSPSVRFLGGKGVVTTTDPVSFSDQDLTLQGTGMVFIVETSALRVLRDVTATVKRGKRR